MGNRLRKLLYTDKKNDFLKKAILNPNITKSFRYKLKMIEYMSYFQNHNTLNRNKFIVVMSGETVTQIQISSPNARSVIISTSTEGYYKGKYSINDTNNVYLRRLISYV